MSEATRRRKEVAAKALEEGVSPLDVMLTTMRALWEQAVDGSGKVVNIGKAMQANVVAKDAAPFLHPKLSAIAADHTSSDGSMSQPTVIQIVPVQPKHDSGSDPAS